MTLIISDGKTVLADGQASVDDKIVGLHEVKIEAFEDVVLGISGHIHMKDIIFNWYKSGANLDDWPKHYDEDGFTFVVFKPEYADVYAQTLKYPCRYEYPCAFGSAADYCYIAMEAGVKIDKIMSICKEKIDGVGGTVRKATIPHTARRKKKVKK